jgi:pyruvoyl-dependent arginine decarboxylase (PvlArgDC)
VIRNAGGRARNAVFDIAFLDTFIKISDIVVVHHTSILPPHLHSLYKTSNIRTNRFMQN